MEIFTLKNGIRVVFEKIEYVKSITMGVYIGAGSVYETEQNNGVSHFLEHMFFKGTEKRNSKEIAEFMDSIGGQLNAYTTKEYTCFYAKVLSEYVEKAVDILSDMLIYSTFTEENIETEKKVICEEIKITEDTPEDLIFDMISEKTWGKSSFGLPVTGTIDSVSNIKRDDLLSYYNEKYVGENIVISVVGNISFCETKALLEKYFSNAFFGKLKSNKIENCIFSRGTMVKKKKIKQCQLCLSLEGLSKNHDLVYTLIVLNSVFGGNVSSRLFQKIREENGLSYSVCSYVNCYKNQGSIEIYAGMNTNELEKVIKIINLEIIKLKKDGLTLSEIKLAIMQIRSELLMGTESLSNRMESYGKGLLLNNKVKNIDDTIKKIDAVTEEKVKDVIDRVFDINKLNVAVLGNVDEFDYDSKFNF